MFRKQVLTLFLIINFCGFFNAGYSQTGEKSFNPQYNPVSIVHRLSYENFRHIKLLRSAIVNFGGGDAEVQKLIDQYAEATAFYFAGKVEESAEKFRENEREIFKAAKKTATEYSRDSAEYLTKGIKRHIQVSIDGKQIETAAVMGKYLDNAKSSQKRAMSIFDDYRYTGENHSTSAKRLIIAIYHYRLAKQNLFMMYHAYIEPMTLDADKKRDSEMKDQLFDKMMKEDYNEDYKKDFQDNKNKIYIPTDNKYKVYSSLEKNRYNTKMLDYRE